MNTDCPCKKCVPPKRNAKCHSCCKEYKEWRDKLTKEKQTAHDKEVCDFILDNIEKRRKKRNARNSN